MATIYPPYVMSAPAAASGSYDIYSRLLMDRIVFLGTPVDDTSPLIIAPLLSFRGQPGEGHPPLHQLAGRSVSAGWRSTTPCSSSSPR
jgi:ATP-dependent Clp protease protease subunit